MLLFVLIEICIASLSFVLDLKSLICGKTLPFFRIRAITFCVFSKSLLTKCHIYGIIIMLQITNTAGIWNSVSSRLAAYAGAFLIFGRSLPYPLSITHLFDKVKRFCKFCQLIQKGVKYSPTLFVYNNKKPPSRAVLLISGVSASVPHISGEW